MLWRDFGPFVTPFVIGCPVPVLEHHARMTAIDWCRNTLCLQRDLDPVLTNGTANAVNIVAPASLAVVRVLAVAVGGIERDLVTPRDGQRFARTNHPGDYCFTPANATLQVYPLEPAGKEVIITAALMPTLLGASTELDDEVANEYVNDIALGVIAAIKRLPQEGLNDPAGASDHQTRYESRRSTVAAKIARGLAAAKTRAPLKTF